jgi:hypothetical protein
MEYKQTIHYAAAVCMQGVAKMAPYSIGMGSIFEESCPLFGGFF